MNEDCKKRNIINKIIIEDKKKNNYNWDEM